jgi:predicted metalloprotease with PDZ domain
MRPGSIAFLFLATVCVTASNAVEIPAPADSAYPGTLKLQVDATDLEHRIFRAHEEIPVAPGPLTLLYPQWLPGNHSPSGPIDKLAGLAFSANGKPLTWQRDPYNVFAFHIEVPSGATMLAADFEFLSAVDSGQGRVVMTPDMLNLQWNTVALYPAGFYASRVDVAASVKLPEGFQFGTALETAGDKGGDGYVGFKSVDFATLVDSPIYAGRYFKRIDLDPGAKVPVHLDIVADDAKYLEITPDQLKVHKALVQQAYKLYASHHYDHYDFLFSLSDKMSGNGLEHHRSSENGVGPEYFTEWNKRAPGRDLLAHEYTHSWNGKFRRGADLATPSFNVPMGDSLLWVYEGQTQFWGFILAARAGLWNADQAHDAIAMLTATYADNRPGFAWRNVQDTTNDPTIARRGSLPYRNYQMSEDYYSAGQLIWFAVDAKLRELSREKKSLDDFAKAFFGVDDGSWTVHKYTFEDVVQTLNAIAPFDWAQFLRERVDGNKPPVDGIAASGWKLVYTDQESEFQKNAESNRKSADFASSIGLSLSAKDAKIGDVRWNGPAFKAGMAPGTTLVAVNGHEFKAEKLAAAITAAKAATTPIDLLVKSGDEYKTFHIDYHEGLKYPHLERIAGTPDRLGAILAPR